jgi:hypothetical protein
VKNNKEAMQALTEDIFSEGDWYLVGCVWRSVALIKQRGIQQNTKGNTPSR